MITKTLLITDNSAEMLCPPASILFAVNKCNYNRAGKKTSSEVLALQRNRMTDGQGKVAIT